LMVMEHAVYIDEALVEEFKRRMEEFSQIVFYSYDLESVVNAEKRVFVDEARGIYAYTPFSGSRPFVEIVPHALIGGVVDPVSGECAIDFVVEYLDRDEALFVPRGSRASILEARGRRVYQLVEEGSEIEPGDKIFYVVTGKHEVRVVRSPVGGVLVHISELVPSKVQTLRAVVVPREQCRRLTKLR